MEDNLHNQSPIIDLIIILNQIKNNTQLIRNVTIVSDPKKIVDQISPSNDEIPSVGLTLEYGEITDNPINGSMVQTLTADVCCTVVLNAQTDLTGAGSHLIMFDSILKDLMHCIYNWRPEPTRYINGFQLNRFERIASLCSNPYEVYCVYFSIPIQIDYLDGYLTEGQKLQVIQTNINHNKSNQLTSINIENKS